MSVNGQNGKPVKGLDISIVKLVPRNERKIAKKYRQRIDSNLACAAARRFGSVKKALEAARVASKPRKPR